MSGASSAGLVGHHEAEARRVRLQAPHDKVHQVGQPDAAPFGLHELAAGDERLQKATERRAPFLGTFRVLMRSRGVAGWLYSLCRDLRSVSEFDLLDESEYMNLT